MSLPSRGAWIEMEKILGTPGCPRRRSPHGERGLKLNSKSQSQLVDSRSPHGERGLKSGLILKSNKTI